MDKKITVQADGGDVLELSRLEYAHLLETIRQEILNPTKVIADNSILIIKYQ